MGENLENVIGQICQQYGNDASRMMDIVRDVQEKYGSVSSEAMNLIAKAVSSQRVEVESVVSFYSFLTSEKKGTIPIRLCNDIIDKMFGVDDVANAFKEELGIDFGETTADGRISLEWTACMGMCDQPPAALVGNKVMTLLSTDSARKIARTLKSGGDVSDISHTLGDGNNANELVKSMVSNHLREKGEAIFAPYESGAGLKKAIALSPVEVIKEIKTSRMRGRGGAGFPTGMKWEFTRNAEGDKKTVICNADEGEPGTFKDRVILTECADLLLEGMTIAGYAIGADLGILYLRAEYIYLKDYLQSVIDSRKEQGLLGANICGKDGFNYDIRIQMGAGAYICGEETALISSCEGLRGDPKNRPPFPAQKGYLQTPTTVNNVETLCCAARIFDKGAGWFAALGSPQSTGVKVLSVSGDCTSPGVYEIPFGTTVTDLLKKVGAENAIAVQVGGPSGQLIAPNEYGRTLCYDDLATGGSIMVFGPGRDILQIVHSFMDFFEDESCGYCTPCRVGNQLIIERLETIMAGRGTADDLDYLTKLGESVKKASRCGLGQTSPNPVLTSLANFREVYEKLLVKEDDGLKRSFDIKAALKTSEQLIGRNSVHFKE